MNSYKRAICDQPRHWNRHSRSGFIARSLVKILTEVLISGIIIFIVLYAAFFTLSSMHLSTHSSEGNSVFQLTAFSSGRKLWIQTVRGEIVIIDLASGERRLVFRPNGRRFVRSSISQDGSTHMFSIDDREFSIVRNNELLVREEMPKSIVPNSMVLSSNGKTFIEVSRGTNVRCWDFASDSAIQTEFSLPQPTSCLAINPAGTRFVVCAKSGCLSLCDVKTHQLLQSIAVHDEVVGDPIFSENERWLAVPCAESVVLYDLVFEKIAWTYPTLNSRATGSVAISADGQWVASWELSRGIQLFDCLTGQLKHTVSDVYANKMAFAPSSESLFTSSNDNLIREWSLSTGREIDQINVTE